MNAAPDATAHAQVRFDAIESVVVDTLRACVDPGTGVATAVIDGRSPLAAFGRMVEVETFPHFDMAKAMSPFEARSLFLFTADLDAGRIGHIKRVVRGFTPDERGSSGHTGIEVIDDRIDALDPAERASLNEIAVYYDLGDTSQCWNVATSCATNRIASSRSRPYSLFTYKALFFLCRPVHVDHHFAYINLKSVRSMNRLRVPFDLVLGREFHLPVPSGYDPGYMGIHMFADDRGYRFFTEVREDRPLTRAVAGTELPIVVFETDREVAIDLTGADDAPEVVFARAVTSAVIDLTDDAGEPVLDLTDDAGGPALDLTDGAVAPVDDRPST
jgi:hypothetical protein